jgi:MOSC domain-containing protein YiiM
MRLAFRELPYGAFGENLTVAGATEDATCLVGLLRRA